MKNIFRKHYFFKIQTQNGGGIKSFIYNKPVFMSFYQMIDDIENMYQQPVFLEINKI